MGGERPVHVTVNLRPGTDYWPLDKMLGPIAGLNRGGKTIFCPCWNLTPAVQSAEKSVVRRPPVVRGSMQAISEEKSIAKLVSDT
jgi:hypothetical protein